MSSAGFNSLAGSALRAGRWFAGLALAASLASGRASGCPYCYSSLVSGGSGVVQALQSGILVLIVPPMLIFAAIAVAAIRGNHRYAQCSELEAADGRAIPTQGDDVGAR
ncbi:MAG TPA: hypothetical protein VL523_16540, partial [Terriglobia bacterium]|nr:hypothetical protein [Terriglobia bacterium]